ncbi:MAG: polysaccharide deacetylase family protein [Desulfobacterales bacterium]|nr:polysaccharide deacetylase family protein [Desulfobacterales bacterium]
MPQPIAAIWRSVPADIALKTDQCLSRACEQRNIGGPVSLFFRADDVAVPGRQLVRLMALFSSFRVPLSLAVVPAWLTESRWRQLKRIGARTPELWCWHQHGWRHANHENKNKKQEFGPGRSASQIRKDLVRGKDRLESLLDNDFYPVFTPPWNRCGSDTLIQLEELGYRGVSRSSGSLPLPPEGLPDFQVNVDLHTRRDPDPSLGWDRLLADLESAVKGGTCGIMIHHQLMNDAAFEFLEMLLRSIVNQKGVAPTDFRWLDGYDSIRYE